ncbi:MAG: adenylyltransferase/cytidyltransferase family protein [Verrucomicrobiota bacterium]
MGEIIPITALAEWRQKQKKTIVATNGCFDILHVGHLRYLKEARLLGDRLVVGLNGDASVQALKGAERPINPEAHRAELLAALNVVDAVVIFPEKRATHFLSILKPHIYVKGGDYTVDQLDSEEVAAVKGGGGEIKILPLVPGQSTTEFLKKISSL